MEQFSKYILIILYTNLIIIFIDILLNPEHLNLFKFKFEFIFISLLGYVLSFSAIELSFLLFKRFDKLISKDLRKAENWNSKLLRQAENFGGAIYNILDILILYGYFHKSKYWPKEFGGTMNLYKELPLEVNEQSSIAQSYYVFYFGHYIHRLVHHIQTGKSSKIYYQMLLHHSLTPALVLVSMIQNIHQWGFAIFACFAFSNLLLNLSRFFKDSIFTEAITHLILIAFVVDWTINRVYYYNLIITQAIIIAAPSYLINHVNMFPYIFFYVVFLSMVGILNTYWWFKIIKIMIEKIFKKKKVLSYEEGHVLKARS